MKLLNLVFLLSFLFYSNPSVAEGNFECLSLTEKIGKKHSIPHKLLSSISLVESGNKKENSFISWPWTLNVDGKSKFFKNKSETLEFLNQNFDKKKNIDVGCMQISLKYHGKKFKNFSEILDPSKNVEYAALFLKKLYKKHKRWNEAVGRYHSSNPQKKIRYIKKVNSFWSQIRQKKIHTYSNFSSKDLQKIEFFKKLLSEKNNLNKG